MALRKWRKTETVVFYGALSLVLSLDEQRKNEIERDLHYIYSPYGLIAVLIKQGINENLYYTFTDQLGSIISLLNPDGSVAEKYSYDAWGRRRNPVSWTYDSIPAPTLIDRGFTGHEHLDEFGLINMNGRMYDPALGRFLSVDPYIQFPESAQSYNGYGYCLNNPLIYNDPSGRLIMQGDFDNRMFDLSQSWFSGIEAGFWQSNSGLGAGGGGGSSWVNSYIDYSNASFENGYGSSTSIFDQEVNKQAGSPGYNGLIRIQTGIMDYYTFTSIDGGKTWRQGNYISSKPLYSTIPINHTVGEIDKMGFQINYGLGYGFKSNFGSHMVRFGNLELLSKEINLKTYKNTSHNMHSNHSILIFGYDYNLPLLNIGYNLSLYTNQKPDFSISFLGWNWSNSTKFTIKQEYGIHLGIIGIKGYMQTNDFVKFFSTWPNARQSFFENTGFPLFTR